MTVSTTVSAQEAFDSRDSAVTLRYQNDLILRGKAGQLAFGLFRAQKRSTRAKTYRRGLRRNAYEGKHEALKYVDSVLTRNPDLVSGWGWRIDRNQQYHNQVLYVDLIGIGQCSFHDEIAASSQKYAGEWDQSKPSLDSILAYCDFVMATVESKPLDESDFMPFGKYVGLQFWDLDSKYVKSLAGLDVMDYWPSLRPIIDERAS